MPCIRIAPGMIVCTARLRRHFCRCGAVARFQCDGPSKTRKSGSCDAHLCERHAHEIGPDRHLCPWCAEDAAKAAPALATATPPPAQLALFAEGQ